MAAHARVRRVEILAITALTAAAFALQAFVGLSIPAHAEKKSETKFFALSIEPRIIRRLLGTRILVADLVWIDTLIKSDILRENVPYTSMYKAARVMTKLDPENFFAYYVFGMYLSVIKDDIHGASALVRSGAQLLKDRMTERSGFSKYFLNVAWRVYYALGYNLIFEEVELEEGSRWIREAAAIETAPEYVKNLGRHIETEAGRLEVGARVLLDLMRRVKRDDEKKAIEKKLLRITVMQELADLNTRFAEYLRTTGASGIPRARALNLFLRSIHHAEVDLLGEKLRVDSSGRIESN